MITISILRGLLAVAVKAQSFCEVILIKDFLSKNEMSIIARSPVVSIRFKGTFTLEDGAGSCEGDYWNSVPLVNI